MVAKQSGDSAGSIKQLKFDYRNYLASNAADTSRSERFSTTKESALPPSSPQSAAHTIIERLRKERGAAVEGYMVSVAGAEPTKQRPAGDAPAAAVSELDSRGGLIKYLDPDNAEAAQPGYLPRMPGEPYARKAINDKIFRGGDFTNTVLQKGGISAWTDDASGPDAPGQAKPRSARHAAADDLHHGGEIKKVGGLGQFGDDTSAHAGSALNASSVNSSFSADGAGELASKGGLVRYLAEANSLSPGYAIAAVDGYLQAQAGQHYPKRKTADPLHHGGELLQNGISRFIDGTGNATSSAASTAGGHGRVSSPRRASQDVIFQAGNLTAVRGDRAANESGFFRLALPAGGAGTNNSQYYDHAGDEDGGYEMAPAEEAVPVLPADVHVSGDSAFRKPKDIVSNRDAANLLGRASELDTTGGIFAFLNSLDPRGEKSVIGSALIKPISIAAAPLRSVGHISKAGGLAGYVGRSDNATAPSGYLAPLPGQEWARADNTQLPDSARGAIDRQGGLGGFLTSRDAIPEGYVSSVEHPGGIPKKRADLDKALVGALDKYGGIGGYYTAASAEAPVAGDGLTALAPLPGQEFARQISGDPALISGRRGKLESGGLGSYMNSNAVLAPGYIPALPGHPDDTPHLMLPSYNNKGALERNGGIAGYLHQAAAAASVDSAESSLRSEGGYVLYPGEAPRKAAVDPLHHYSAVAVEGTKAAQPDTRTAGVEGREGKMVAGKVVTSRTYAPPDVPDHHREAHMVASKIVETTRDQPEISAYVRDEKIRSGFVGGRRGEVNEEPVVKRETSLLAVAKEQKAIAAKIQAEAERETLARAYMLPEQQAALRQNDDNNVTMGGFNDASTISSAASVASVAPAADLPVNASISSNNNTSGYASRHLASSAASAAAAAQMDVRRLARIRKAIRDVLPKKGGAAVTILRQRLGKEDGDRDGVISDIELLRGLSTLNPSLTPSDISFIVRYMRTKARHVDTALVPEGHRVADTTGGLVAGIDISGVAEWVTRQPGGVEATSKKGDDAAAEDGDAAATAVQADTSDRITWNSRSQKFTLFRAGWEERHGAAAQRELASDLAAGSVGPTWTRAEPQPFKVLHLASGPPARP